MKNTSLLLTLNIFMISNGYASDLFTLATVAEHERLTAQHRATMHQGTDIENFNGMATTTRNNNQPAYISVINTPFSFIPQSQFGSLVETTPPPTAMLMTQQNIEPQHFQSLLDFKASLGNKRSSLVSLRQPLMTPQNIDPLQSQILQNFKSSFIKKGEWARMSPEKRLEYIAQFINNTQETQFNKIDAQIADKLGTSSKAVEHVRQKKPSEISAFLLPGKSAVTLTGQKRSFTSSNASDHASSPESSQPTKRAKTIPLQVMETDDNPLPFAFDPQTQFGSLVQTTPPPMAPVSSSLSRVGQTKNLNTLRGATQWKQMSNQLKVAYIAHFLNNTNETQFSKIDEQIARELGAPSSKAVRHVRSKKSSEISALLLPGKSAIAGHPVPMTQPFFMQDQDSGN